MVHTRIQPASSRQGYAIIPQAQRKASRALVDEVADLSGLSKKEMATLIGLTERALYKTTTGDFSVLISEHLFRLKALFEHGLVVFDQHKKTLTQWLKTPLAELATPETGFDTLIQSVAARPLDEISQTTGPYDLLAAANQLEAEFTAELTRSESVAYPTPLSLLNTATGIGLVDDVFTRIEYGVFS
ncbi:antitoxin Xre-like helix-turn-helix domain-containing protein [Spirosoma migulaei]